MFVILQWEFEGDRFFELNILISSEEFRISQINDSLFEKVVYNGDSCKYYFKTNIKIYLLFIVVNNISNSFT